MVFGPERQTRSNARKSPAFDSGGSAESLIDSVRVTPSRSVLEARRAILALLFEHRQLSRTDLARLTRLNKPTITNHVAGLLDDNLVRETGSGASTGGRRPILLEINESSRLVAGIEVDAEYCRVLVANLNGDPVAESSTPLAGYDPCSVVDCCAESLSRLVEREILLGCGVAFPGLVDRRADTVDLPAPFDWHGARIRELLESRLGLPVYVTDRGKAAGLGEMWLLGDEPFDDLIYLYLGRGVGGAIVFGRQVHWGVGSIAGEIGHMVIDPGGPQCACGNRGCLESLVSTTAIEVRKRRLHDVWPESTVDVESRDPGDIGSAAERNDPLALALIEATARWVGLALASLVNVLNPGAIVIGGPTAAWGEPFRRQVERVVEQATLLPARQEAPIKLGRARERAPVLGAVALAIQHAPELLIPAYRVPIPASRSGG